MTASSFNKKKWLKNHLAKVRELKAQGLTLQAVIAHLKTSENMPFDLTESLLSRYLKEFANDESSTLQTDTALRNKIERQKERLTRQNNEIQNQKRRLERVLERNEDLIYDNEQIKERNRLLENKFLDGEARLKDLRRYNGFNNVHWKVADLTQKNDEMFQSVLMLERLSERLAAPHEEADAKIEALENELLEIKRHYAELDLYLGQSTQETEQLKRKISALTEEKQVLKLQLSHKETPVIHQDQDRLEELSRERQKCLQERNQLKMLSKRLESDLSNSNHQLRETKNELYESRNNAKQRDFWRLLALSFGGMVVIFILIFILL
jgi:DNA repair exonuclease SbcCD ATPase subunit